MIQVVILAAGQGKRMHSALPKVLHHLAGKPLLQHVLEVAATLAPETPPIVVYGHQGKKLREALMHAKVNWVQQKEQLGTGHAVLETINAINQDDQVLILYGDVPLISLSTLQKLIQETPAHALGFITVNLAQPTGYGRIKRDQHERVISVIEEKDASEDERLITEVNSGIYLVPAVYLQKWLPTLNNHNAQKEYYLTDILKFAHQENISIHAVQPADSEEVLGVNDRAQLAQLERFYQQKMAEKLLQQGVTLIDPARIDIRGSVEIGRDVVIDINVILEGEIKIGDECVIGPHTIIRNTILGDRVEIKANSIIEGAEIADDCSIGPFARLRTGSHLQKEVHIGNFVEIKNSLIGEESKINHLSYVGDSDIGKHVNIGAGTITCNYDGANKHKTIIGDHAFIGSCTQLIAPVTVGEGATIGAGSTITRNAPPHQLTLTRAEQHTIAGWKRPQKK